LSEINDDDDDDDDDNRPLLVEMTQRRPTTRQRSKDRLATLLFKTAAPVTVEEVVGNPAK